MTQEKFIALSKEKVAKLNKGSKEAEIVEDSYELDEFE